MWDANNSTYTNRRGDIMYKEIKIGKSYVNFGFSLKAFTLGINVAKGYVMLDLAFIWIGVEW